MTTRLCAALLRAGESGQQKKQQEKNREKKKKEGQRFEHGSSGGRPGAGRVEKKKEGQHPVGSWAFNVSSDVPPGKCREWKQEKNREKTKKEGQRLEHRSSGGAPSGGKPGAGRVEKKKEGQCPVSDESSIGPQRAADDWTTMGTAPVFQAFHSKCIDGLFVHLTCVCVCVCVCMCVCVCVCVFILARFLTSVLGTCCSFSTKICINEL